MNLANIIKDASLYNGDDSTVHPVIAALQNLSVDDTPDTATVLSGLDTVRDECNIDLSHRCLAGGHQAYPTLIKLLKKFSADRHITKAVLQALCALVNGQPDLLDEEGSTLFIQYLSDFKEDHELLLLVVRLIRLLCVKHEANRQNFVGKDLIRLLSGLLQSQQSDPELVKEVCFALRVLTFDDDIRVPFGKAHEHAKMIVTEGDALKAILKICEGGHNYIFYLLFPNLSNFIVLSGLFYCLLNLHLSKYSFCFIPDAYLYSCSCTVGPSDVFRLTVLLCLPAENLAPDLCCIHVQ